MVKTKNQIIVILLALIVSSFAGAQTVVQISDILRNPADYNRTPVAVSGNVTNLKVDSGLETFRLCNNRCIWVLAWGHAQLQEGQFLTVSGEFRLEKPIGPCVLRNIIVVQKGTL